MGCGGIICVCEIAGAQIGNQLACPVMGYSHHPGSRIAGELHHKGAHPAARPGDHHRLSAVQVRPWVNSACQAVRPANGNDAASSCDADDGRAARLRASTAT